MNVPFTLRAIWPGFGSFSTLVTSNAGDSPCGMPSARLVSPSCGEGFVAHRELAVAVVVVAGDREVPRQVEARARDAGAFEGREEFFEVRPAHVDGFIFGGDVVAVVAEARGRFEAFMGGVLEVPQRDDVAVTRGEVDRRVNLHGRVGRFRRRSRSPPRSASVCPSWRRSRRRGRCSCVYLREVVDRHRPGCA